MFLVDTLSQMGFAVLQAASAREALSHAERTRNIELAIIDIGLPDRSGLEVAGELRSRSPAMGIAITSGYGQEARGKLRNDPRVIFIAKPFDAEGMRTALSHLRGKV
jgi:DNA-binding response OmpR family regulator